MRKGSVLMAAAILLVFAGCSSAPVAAKAETTPVKVEVKKEEVKKKAGSSVSIVPAGTVEKTVKAEKGADLSGAEVRQVYPLVVRPGSLMSISGAGFGEKASEVFVGSVKVSEFLKWEDEVIWFRVPEGVKEGDAVKLGDTVSDGTITLAPKDAIRVVWEIDAKKAQEIINAKFADYGAEEAPEIESPLFIKGQWVKKIDGFANYASNWDGGTKTKMYNIQGTSIWTSECFYTEANFEQFKKKVMYFAIEDSNTGKRKLSSFESDAALIIKKEWGAADDVDESDNDPGLVVSTKYKRFNADTNTIYVTFPVAK